MSVAVRIVHSIRCNCFKARTCLKSSSGHALHLRYLIGMPASVVIHSDGELFKAALARATFCRMSAADLVQVRGLGSALQAAT